MSIKLWSGVLLSLLLPLAVVATVGNSNRAQTVQATAMNAAPYSDARTVGQLPVNTNLTLVERQGGWYHVQLDNGQQGWVPMTSVRLGQGSEVPAQNGWSLGGLFESGRASTTSATATTGVRGLNEGTIQNAVPDPQAVQTLDKYAATPAKARHYAAELKLKSEQVAYLPKGGK